MTQTGKFLHWEKHLGDPVRAGGVTVTPQSQALGLRLPFGGFVWNRPVAVLVEREERVERVSIVDVTRVAQAALLGLGCLFFALSFVLSTRRGRNHSDQGTR